MSKLLHLDGGPILNRSQTVPAYPPKARANLQASVCVHELTSARAAVDGSAVALVGPECVVTYEELDRRANQLANDLRSLGVGPDVVVGLCLERSPALAVGALGIMKAGGAYLPLDASHPGYRLGFMLRDSGAALVVTQDSVAPRLAGTQMRTISLDDVSSSRHSGSEQFQTPPSGVNSHNLAYVIYTSGSTGTPKGVMIEHGSLLNLVRWHLEAFGVTASDRACQVASPAFDAAVWELWPYLVAGASVHFTPEAIRTDVTALRDWLRSERITIGFLPTPLVEMALDLDWSGMAELRLLLTGGDTLHRHPQPGVPFVLVNNYGPTEATVVATSGSVPTAVDTAERPSIGRPIANTILHVLDESLEPVPAGGPGELYIGGDGLARGYLNRPELTAQRFVANPFSDMPGARLYRTGDLVRWRDDGELEFLGRIDEQVKIRGFRVELDEIVTVLNSHPGVQASVVVARGGGQRDKRLVAYVVSGPGGPPDRDSLRNHLTSRLPDYMVPASYVWLTQLPLTANGKVDREALPEPDAENTGRGGPMIEPRTPAEEVLSSIVCGLLGTAQVGLDENFFVLGGHSLLGAQLIVDIHDRFGVSVSLRTLFDNPTVEAMAATVEKRLLEQLESLSDEEAEEQLARLTLDANADTR